MILQRFTALRYRNIRESELSFSPGMNLLSGENAQGKTNVLEGIYFFARGKSFRGAADGEQVLFGERGFSLSLSYLSGGRENTLAYRFENGKREREKNGYTVSSASEMIGSFRAVLFYPEHLSLVKGGPAERRLFLNVAVSQLDGVYIRRLSAYQKQLENRNILLKNAQKTGYLDRDLLDSFSEGMAAAAAYIHLRREEYIERLLPYAEDFLSLLSGGRERLILSYESSLGTHGAEIIRDKESKDREKALCEAYFRLFCGHIGREIAAGTTLFGIQRDDMEIKIGERDARLYASQGQQRSVVLALKLGEGEVAREVGGEYPVYLFDDVLSELDEARRLSVLSMGGDRQMIVTSCEAGALGRYAAREIRVENGVYTPR